MAERSADLRPDRGHGSSSQPDPGGYSALTVILAASAVLSLVLGMMSGVASMDLEGSGGGGGFLLLSVALGGGAVASGVRGARRREEAEVGGARGREEAGVVPPPMGATAGPALGILGIVMSLGFWLASLGIIFGLGAMAAGTIALVTGRGREQPARVRAVFAVLSGVAAVVIGRWVFI